MIKSQIVYKHIALYTFLLLSCTKSYAQWTPRHESLNVNTYSLLAEQGNFVLEFYQTSVPFQETVSNFHTILNKGILHGTHRFYGHIQAQYSLPYKTVLYTLPNPINPDFSLLSLTSIYESFSGITNVYTISLVLPKKNLKHPSKEQVQAVSQVFKDNWEYPKQQAQSYYNTNKLPEEFKQKIPSQNATESNNKTTNPKIEPTNNSYIPPEAQMSMQLLNVLQQQDNTTSKNSESNTNRSTSSRFKK